MDFLNEFGARHEGVLSLASGVFGLAGFVFGIWRVYLERRAREALVQKEQELEKALAQLKHLDSYAADLKHYTTAA
jgi:hypothetical protein